MTSLRNSVVRLVYTRKSGGGAFGDKNEELLLRNALSPHFQLSPRRIALVSWKASWFNEFEVLVF